jgi:hypothetical protein
MRTRPASQQGIIPLEVIERRIFLIRRQKVMIDTHLADLYEVPTFRLNEAVKRNRKRFPEDFMFQLSVGETAALTSQFAMSKSGRGGRRTRPYAFTEQGVAMLSTVLNSDRAIAVNIAIMRVFVRLRAIFATHTDILSRLDALEKEQQSHGAKIKAVFDAIRKLIETPPAAPQRRPIGFTVPDMT